MRDQQASQRIKRVGKFGVFLSMAWGVLSCGPPKAPANSTSSASPESLASQSPETPQLPELAPAAIPANLVAWAVLPSPGNTLDTSMEWAGLDIPWRPLLGALSGPLGAVLPVVDWNAPLDAAITLDPESRNRPRFFLAASIGLLSVQATLEAFRAQEIPVQFEMPGVHSVHLTSRVECFISRALGVATARMVCSDSRRSLDRLHPYLTRGKKPRSVDGLDASAELSFPFAWNQFGDKAAVLQRALPLLLGEIATGEPNIDSAMRNAAGPLSAELVATLSELSRIHVDLQLSDAQQSLKLEVGVELTAGQSWPSKMLATAADAIQPAPESFWHLPSDATQAWYQHNVPSPDKERAVDGVLQLLEAGVAYLNPNPTVRKRWIDSLRGIFLLSGASTVAQGPLPAGEATEGISAKLRSSLGYWLVTFEQDEQKVVAQFVNACSELYADPSLRKSLQKRLGVDVLSLPPLRRRAAHGSLEGSDIFEFTLPAGIVQGKSRSTGTSKPSTTPIRPITVQIVVGHRGTASVVGISTSAGLLVDKLAPLLSPANSQAPTISQRTDLQLLRTEAANTGGFISVSGLPQALLPTSSKAGKALQELMPESQLLALPTLWKAEKDNERVRGKVQFRMPRALIRALGSAVQSQ